MLNPVPKGHFEGTPACMVKQGGGHSKSQATDDWARNLQIEDPKLQQQCREKSWLKEKIKNKCLGKKIKKSLDTADVEKTLAQNWGLLVVGEVIMGRTTGFCLLVASIT